MSAFEKYPLEEHMKDGDIVVNSTGNGTLGRIGIFRDSDRLDNNVVVPDSHVTVVRAYHEVEVDYLFYVLKYHQPFLEKLGEGSTNQTELRPSNIAELLIPIPPLNEQTRIVAKLYEIIPMIITFGEKSAKLDAYNQFFPETLKKSILQQAVQGKLVPQDPSDEPAEALLERIRAEKQRLIKEGKIKKDKHESVIFRRDNSHYEKLDGVERCIDDELPFEIPDSWEWERWGNISISIQYGYNAAAKNIGRIKMVRISDIQDGSVVWDSVPYCDIDEKDIDTYLLRPNDILFARTGGTVGKSYLVRDIKEPAIYAGYLIRTRYSSLLLPEYLKYFMESELYWIQLRSGTIATAQPNCNGKTLANMLIPLPPLSEQHRIVAKIEEILPMLKGL